ncbi:MAG: hypothetical protein HQ538_03435 [Parcubacteria group bacterium]|nr:hypothetical protein [Parcubacteria group bacterium]
MILTKKNIYIATAITCLGLVVFGIFVVAPYVQDIFTLSHDIKEMKSNVEDFDLKEENFKKLKEDEEKADLTLNNLSRALVSKENSLEFIVLLEEVASKTSSIQAIEVVNKSEDEETNKRGEQDPAIESLEDPLKNIEALYFKVRLQSSYKNLLLYLAELESLGIYTDVMSMEITSSSTSATSTNKPFEGEAPTDIIRTTLEIRAFAQ